MSDWVLENVRFTIYNEERKERVIVQKSNGDLTVTSKQRGDEAPEEKPRAEAKHDVGAGAKAAAAARKPAEKKPPKADAPQAPSRPQKQGTSLEWRALVDAGYDGFAAKSHGAEIQVLKTKDDRWAMYVFWARGVMKHIQCFTKLAKAKTFAQALHDGEFPERPEPRLTQEMIDNACPAPAEAAAPEGPPKSPRRRAPKSEKDAAPSKPEESAPAAPPAPSAPATPASPATDELTPELRADMRKEFASAVREAMAEVD